MIMLNRADPPPLMRDAVICEVDPDADRGAIVESVREILAEVAAYVPGYRLAAEPRFDGVRVIVLLEIEGAGDFLERYSGTSTSSPPPRLASATNSPDSSRSEVTA